MNNTQYVDQNCPEKIKRLPDVSCQCTDFDGAPDPECHNCKGTGVDPLLAQCPGDYPFELHLSERNFDTLFSVLCVDTDVDEILPQRLLNNVKTLNPDLVLRGDETNGNDFDFGVDTDRVQYYISRLIDICDQAMKREELVIWH